MTTQDKVFLEGEGDRFFDRNKSAILGKSWVDHDLVLRLLGMASLSPKDVLEVGCSNGFRLDEIQSRFKCRATGVEPSAEAVQNGKAKYPSVTMMQGLASSLPIPSDGRFDLVIVNFVLHWIDRSQLLRSVSEIDRMVQEQGCLLIGDFFPETPQRVAYHHLPEEANVWTYKQDYAGLFTASNLYESVLHLDFDHSTNQPGKSGEPRNAARVTLLRKSWSARYETIRPKK